MALTIPTSLTRSPLNSWDENVLFGRASEVKRIVENCEAGRLTVVTGAPGLGMSSLLRAGVTPALLRADFITVVFTDWQGRSLSARIREAIVLAIHEQGYGAFASAAEPLCDLLERVRKNTGKTVALVLDQFEDYLRCHSGTDVSDNFDAELSKTISNRAGRFVIGLQEQELPEFHRLSHCIPNLMGYSFSLAPITQDAATEMVRATAAHADMEAEPAAVDLLVSAPTAMVAFASGSPGVHPLYAKLAVERLIHAEANLKSHQARAATILANGGADRMILESLDFTIKSMGDIHAKVFFRWNRLLLTPNCHRQPASEAVLLENAGKWNRSGSTLLALLQKNGILRTIELPAGVRYELTRDSMGVIIKDWWSRKESAIIARHSTMFRVGSISIAVGAIVLGCVIYLFVGAK